MSGLLTLAERVELAEGPDRSLDVLIWLSVVERPEGGRRDRDMVGREPAYTASIDAAMSLVPDTTDLTMGRVWCIRRFAHITDGEQTWSAEAVTEALALCAAALKARASMETTYE